MAPEGEFAELRGRCAELAIDSSEAALTTTLIPRRSPTPTPTLTPTPTPTPHQVRRMLLPRDGPGGLGARVGVHVRQMEDQSADLPTPNTCP